jgi:hypothetical protein
MIFSKNFNLVLGILFTISFIYSLFDQRVMRELLIWDVNIWIYRSYRFALAFLFIKLYYRQREEDSKMNN